MSARDDIPGLGSAAGRPQPNRAVDFTRVSLSPAEGFVLSRVDGATTYREIFAMSGLGVDATVVIVRRLLELDLIVPPPGAPPVVKAPEAARARANASPPVSSSSPPSSTTAIALLARLDDGSPVDPALLVDAAGLDPLWKTRVVRVHRRLATLSPHDLLGVPENADAGTVKRAYFAASKELHPDRFYGQDLGGFREKLAELFARCAKAFEELAPTRTRKKGG